MKDVVKHKLPEDTGEGEAAWFERMSPFLQEETLRQVRYKRRHWRDLPDGAWRHNPYPHILPKGNQEKAFFEPFLIPYMQAHDIAFHAESLNLRSSQACCLNFLYYLRQNLEQASEVLRGWFSNLARVISIEFEYTGPEAVTEWLGEPPGGKRGMNRTSVDAAIWWADANKKPRLTLVEWKYTEKGFGSCGGYLSSGNKDRSRCTSLDVRSIRPHTDCYLMQGDKPTIQRHYWDHMKDAGVKYVVFEKTGCPFRGPLYQLLRQQLLAHWLETKTDNTVDVAVACFKNNTDLMRSPGYLRHVDKGLAAAWKTFLAEPERFQVLYVEDLMAHCDYLAGVATSPWREYLRERYGV
ncbi:MAG TPA: hypothetical protein VMW79_05250 [Anaerolineae bacterium]|nr:hypothetical protein [Anaerolineae bacterium]HUW94602.1 hypothetical protein [Anaerolineae bacterium]